MSLVRILALLLVLASVPLLSSAEPPVVVVAFLKQHCVDCHGPDQQKGDLRLDTLGADFTDRETARAWLEARDSIGLGQMPPEKKPRPAVADIEAVSGWIIERMRMAARESMSRDGRVLLRRLNRTEYANTIRDLLRMEFLPGESPVDFLPADGTVEGFDKVSVGLLLDPSLLEKYYQVARMVAERAIVSGPPLFKTEVMRMEFADIGRNRAIRYLCDRPGFNCLEDHIEVINGTTRSFGRMHYPGHRTSTPVRGMYRVSVRAGARRGSDGEPVKMLVTQSHPDDSQEKIMEVEVAATPDAPEVFTVVLPRDELGTSWHVKPVKEVSLTVGSPTYNAYANGVVRKAGREGDYANAIRYRGRMLLEGGHENSLPRHDRIETGDLPMLHLDWIEVEGPLHEQWPPKSHTTVLFKGADAEPSLEYVREIFARLLPRAWRRPVATDEMEPIVRYVERELNEGRTFEQAIRAGLVATLTSPNFIFLEEPAGEERRPLNGHEVASRLSYFLWSSMPDDELANLAAAGRLRDPAVIEAQVDRLIRDDKIGGFIDGFAAQWLRTKTFLNFEPDARQYREYDAELGQSMVGETLAFFRELLLHDLSALNLIDSDFTMLNERLARHYGIEGVRGKEFRRVSLPADSHRGGLLRQAGVLLAGSDGDRTKPVSRGIYVREVLFNDPPPPPPPNAGEIEPNIKGRNLTVRDRLVQHQQIEACAACHRTIDPYGLALENYNVIGKWRTRQDGEGFRGKRAPEIVATGRLPSGDEFDGPDSFIAILRGRADRFRRGLTERLMVYALGRPLEPGDSVMIEELAERMKREGDTLRSLLKGVTTSKVFLEK